MTTTHQNEIGALRGLSARVGRDPLLVQASSGNTSMKVDGVLWIKASGKWLSRATEEDTFIPVPMARLLASLLRDEDISEPGATVGGCYLRASIETAMHAVLPHAVVVHVHSVNTIAWAVRRDGRERLAERLSGIPWCWIPYTSSGMPLARSIKNAVSVNPGARVFVLANHGLVVCGDDCLGAEELLQSVEERLAVSPRAGGKFGDSITAGILRGGVLYPCQAMFLGTQLPPLNESAWEEMSHCQREVLFGLVEVAQRIEVGAPVRYLSEGEIQDLFSQDSHRYLARAEMAGQGTGCGRGRPPHTD